MNRCFRIAPLLLSALLAVSSPVHAKTSATSGYHELPPLDPALVLAAPPSPSSPGAAVDEAAYQQALIYVGTARWEEAIADSDESIAAILKGFEPAVGVALSPVSTPRLHALLANAFKNMGPSVQRAKAHYNRKRPYATSPSNTPICEPVAPERRATAGRSYPSGHATSGWYTAYLLAGLVPDRASAILGRAAEYAQSRVVCRVHYPSDILAGRLLAAALVSILQGNDKFERDFVQAKEELAGLRARTVAR